MLLQILDKNPYHLSKMNFFRKVIVNLCSGTNENI